jgi:hypothetical protein
MTGTGKNVSQKIFQTVYKGDYQRGSSKINIDEKLSKRPAEIDFDYLVVA